MRAGDDRYGDEVMEVMASHLPVDDMGAARELLDALRSLPVEDRMEAMGMIEHDLFMSQPPTYRIWIEADA